MKQTEDRMYINPELVVPETPDPGKRPQPWGKTHVVGKKMTRTDAYQRVSGAATYPSDVILPNMLYGAILRCPHPNARVKKVDTTEAAKMPGVRTVISASTPGMNPDFTYRGKGKTKLFDSHCRYEGDTVAAVAAETPYQAWDAVRAVKVEYEVLPFVVDERAALSGKAPKVHEKGNTVQEEKYERGDTAKGFKEADKVLEMEFRCKCELHTPIERHGCVARWDGDQLTLWDSTQGVFVIQKEVALLLNMPMAKVRVIGHYMGGGFGSKLQASKYNIIAALLAKATGKPVKLFLSREETFLAMGNRPPTTMKLKAGVKKDGTLTALDFTGIGASGAFPAGGVQLLDWQIRDLYTCPNVRCNGTDVYINAGPARPFRAPGHPPASWALEQIMDALALELGIDPVELRLKNVPTVSQARNNIPYTSTGLKECLKKGAEAFGWDKRKKELAQAKEEPHIKTGIGMAGGLWFLGGGFGPATVIVKLFGDGSANLNMGAADLGTGFKTVAAMIVAEELGLRLDKIQIENADTGTTQFTMMSGGSKTIPVDGSAVREAAVHVKQKLLAMAAKDLEVSASDIVIKGGDVVSKTDPSKKKKITEISEFKKLSVIVGVGTKGPNPKGKAIQPFAAQFCEVKVNTGTGEVEIVRFVAAQDSGRIMNRLTYDGQVIGGITMGIGFGATEGRVLDGNQTGKLCNKNWHDYKLPTALDVPPDIESIPVELIDNEANVISAKGLGEPVTIPTAAVIANAVYNAVEVRVTETPISPLQLSKLLAERTKKG
jgi:CO/xanthine dehydrogenase Mo-binding subunit